MSGCDTPQVMAYYREGPGQFQLGTNGFCGGGVHTRAITWSETRQLEELDCESDLYSSGDAAGINQNRNTIRVGKDHECVESHA